MDPISGVPAPRLKNTFETYDPKRHPAGARLMAKAQAVAEGRAWCGFFVGDSEAGKTHLAIAAMQAFHNGGIERARFWTVPDFLDWIRERCVKGEWSPQELLRNYLTHDFLLVLDDLGVENRTDYAYEQLYRVINARRDNELPTIVTCNLGTEGIDSRFLARLKSGLVVCRKTNEASR